MRTTEVPFFSADDLQAFSRGENYHIYHKMGCHLHQSRKSVGAQFSVWAPNAKQVSVVGDFNQWDPERNPLTSLGSTGIWTGFVSEANEGHNYKYAISSRLNNYQVQKSDPYAFHCETPPKTSSVIWNLEYKWSDQKWMESRRQRQSLSAPISIYEIHLGSWRKEQGEFLTYREMAKVLPTYIKEQGFTHVEFLPVMEHPFYGSWGYQITAYFAPTSRYGTPQDFMHLIDELHKENIGVFLDWVPSHFPEDQHGLGYFDGSHLYEHADPRKGFHPDWKSLIFNYGRNEVQNFLISNALFWLDKYHIDGLRVDAVASMLYLDYSRKNEEWIPNIYGGRENLEAISFLKKLNEVLYREFPDVQLIAEESTAWPMVSRPTYIGGLGFGMKWDMGWMHDTLSYFRQDPIYRKFHHDQLTFRMFYAFNENFVLSLSHDEVVHGKSSLFNKMPGDTWQKMANLRCLYSLMYAQPGKKLLFMGSEFAQQNEWNHDDQLQWSLTERIENKGLQQLVLSLNQIYRKETAFFKTDFSPEGFRWIDHHDRDQSILSFLRSDQEEMILTVFNFTPVPRHEYLLGVPKEGIWKCILNSDDAVYGGSGNFNITTVKTFAENHHGLPQSIKIILPPLAALYFKWQGDH